MLLLHISVLLLNKIDNLFANQNVVIDLYIKILVFAIIEFEKKNLICHKITLF